MVMLIADSQNIREIIAFPKNKKSKRPINESTISSNRTTTKRCTYKTSRLKNNKSKT